ncbi:MAG: deoxyribose-phosphate aldolase, partial [Colwellia sp.]|nr:deoxyribose-phosphate aldolase [Colwellia sp.]
IYLTLAKDILGDNWTTSDHFRFGASSLLSNLLSTLGSTDVGDQSSVGY